MFLLNSSHFRLMIAGLWVALVDYKRLLGVLLWNKAVPPQQWTSMFSTPWKNYVLLGLQIVIMGWHVYTYVEYGINTRKQFGPNRERPALYGIHDVDVFVLNGDTIPPLLTDTVRWKKAYMDLPGFRGLSWGIKMMDDRTKSYSAELDSISPVLILKPRGDTVNVYRLNYSFDGENLSLNGILEGDTLQIKTSYFDPDDFELRSRGFHWINEVPYNRRVPYRQ